MIRFDVNEEAGIQWGAEGGRNTELEAVLFLSINCIFPKACDQKITPFYMLISLH